MDTTTTVISSDGDSNSEEHDFVTTLPVIIQIKVKPNRRRRNEWRLPEAEVFAKTDERHRSERYLSNRDDFRASTEISGEHWRQTEHPQESWQIFERKPGDRFNQSLREMLNKSLTEAVSAGSQASSPRELLQYRSESDCKCDLKATANVADILSDIPRLSTSFHPSPTTSSRCSSVIEQKLFGPMPFSKVIEVTNSNGTLERDAGKVRGRMVRLSNEKTGTFISATQTPKWIKEIEQPNKWTRSQREKICSREPSIRAKQPTVKLNKRPITSKRNQPQLLPRNVADKREVMQLPPTVIQSPLMLDYRKIVEALQYAGVAEKCILLEALKGLLTNSKDYAPSETIEQFIANDLLKLRANRLLSELLWPVDDLENVLVQQNCVASLLNAIVSYKEGRKYFDGISMFETLTANALGNSSIEKSTLNHLIALMAKLSVNTFHRHDFGKYGLLEWLINHMTDAEYSSSEYFFKYTFRLLLNLTTNPNTFTVSNDRTIHLLTLILRLYERPDQQPNRELIRKALSNIHRCKNAPAHQINVRGIFMGRIKKTNDMSERAALKEWLNETALKNLATTFHTFDKDIAYHDVMEAETARRILNSECIDGEAFLRTKFVKVKQEKFKPIEIVELNSWNEKSKKHQKSHRLLLPLLKHTFSEHTMDFRNIPRVARFFPKRKLPAVLNPEYRKLDFSSILEQKCVGTQKQPFERYNPVVNNIIKEEPSFVPFTVLPTRDESQCKSPHSRHTDFKCNFVDPIIDSFIKSIHQEPILRLSESDSEVVVKEFTRNLRPNNAIQSAVRIVKRLNIPVRNPPIEIDLQALIKSVDDTEKINGTKLTGVAHRIETAANNCDKLLKVDTGDEKDVIIKLYNPEVVPTERRRSSSLGSIKNIRNKLSPSKLCSDRV